MDKKIAKDQNDIQNLFLDKWFMGHIVRGFLLFLEFFSLLFLYSCTVVCYYDK